MSNISFISGVNWGNIPQARVTSVVHVELLRERLLIIRADWLKSEIDPDDQRVALSVLDEVLEMIEPWDSLS